MDAVAQTCFFFFPWFCGFVHIRITRVLGKVIQVIKRIEHLISITLDKQGNIWAFCKKRDPSEEKGDLRMFG